MAVQVKLTAVKKLSNSSTTSLVELTNFNFGEITSAIKEFLTSINYNQSTNNVSVDIDTVASGLVTVRRGLSVYGTQLVNGAYPTVINLSPSGTVTAKNFIADDVAEILRLRLRVYGALPTTGVPGEIVYIAAQGNRIEGVYVWLVSTGWTLLSGGSGAAGTAKCMQEVIMQAVADNVSADNTNASEDGIFLVPAPLAATAFMLFVNGQLVPVGDGDITAPAYLSNDGGLNAVTFNEADSTCQLYWNPSIAGYNLDTGDTLLLHYFTEDPFCSQSGYTCSTEIIDSSSTSFNFGIEIIGVPSGPAPITICRRPNPIDNSGGATLPPGFYLQNSVYAFTITDWDGVCPPDTIIKFTMPQSMSAAEFNLIRIFHEVSGILVDETVDPGDIVGNLYIPNYATRAIYAQVDSFSPFYLIPDAGVTTTTSSTTTTTATPSPTTSTTTTCAPNLIRFETGSGELPSVITFYGTPAGPFEVLFTDQSAEDHTLTGLIGDMVELPWTFNVANPVFQGIPNGVGTYVFSKGGCEYEVIVPIQAAATTTTTTAAATTTTTRAAETTTTTTAAATTTTTTAAATTTTTKAAETTTTTRAPETTTTTTAAPTTPTLFTVTNSDAGSYIINSSNNPLLTLERGLTYTFSIRAIGHPFWIKTTRTTGQENAYDTGVINNGTDNGTLTFVVADDAPSTLYYNCEYHSSMAGTINIINDVTTPTTTTTTAAPTTTTTTAAPTTTTTTTAPTTTTTTAAPTTTTTTAAATTTTTTAAATTTTTKAAETTTTTRAAETQLFDIILCANPSNRYTVNFTGSGQNPVAGNVYYLEIVGQEPACYIISQSSGPASKELLIASTQYSSCTECQTANP